MCGITGFAGVSGMGQEQLRRMCNTIVHRGPDDEGLLVDPPVGIGMRRLSIIDPGGGHQPISNEDGTVHVVFNGEIYNYRELRRDLELRGHHFRTDTDTECLVHLYEERGRDFVHELRGMFAIAVWDARRDQLLLVRDRLGIKPLYYREEAGGVLFGSELKALRAAPGLDWTIDRRAVALYLAFGYIPDPFTIYGEARKLPPGHMLDWEMGRGAEIHRYWSPVRSQDENLDEETAAREVRRLLEQSVRYRLIADVPLGAFLSGGIDSSAIVALMARQMDRPVKTFSIGFEEPEFNEAPNARRVAAALGTDHSELVVRPDMDELVERVVDAFDEPFADSSAIPTFLVSELARRDVKVVLSGDGGDELFGGYTRYLEHLLLGSALPRALSVPLRAGARRLPQSAPGRNRLLDMARSFRGRYMGRVADPLDAAEGGVARANLVSEAGAWDRLLDDAFDATAGRDAASQLMLVDLLTYLPGDILTKVDRMTMAVSLEARVPVLDHELAEFAATLPSHLKIRSGTGKWILRRALAGLLPEFVFSKKKQGFGIPLKPWFRGPLSGRVRNLLREGNDLHEFVEPAAVQRVVTEHQSGRRDHSPMLWKLLVLQLWLEGQTPMEPPTAAVPAGIQAS